MQRFHVNFIWLLCSCFFSVQFVRQCRQLIHTSRLKCFLQPSLQSDLLRPASFLLLWLECLLSLICNCIFTFNPTHMSWWLVDVWNLVSEEWRSQRVSHCLGGGEGASIEWPVGHWADFQPWPHVGKKMGMDESVSRELSWVLEVYVAMLS